MTHANEKNDAPSTAIRNATPHHHPLPVEGRPQSACLRSVRALRYGVWAAALSLLFAVVVGVWRKRSALRRAAVA